MSSAPRPTPARLYRAALRDARARAHHRWKHGPRARPWGRLAGPLTLAWLALGRGALLRGGEALAQARIAARARAAEEREVARLDRTVGGGRHRGPVASFFKRTGQRLTLGLANLLFPRPRAPLPPLDRVRKVLVIRTDERVGNQLLTSPLLRALKRGLPAAELHLLAPRQGELVRSRHVDRLWPWRKKDAFKRPWALVGLVRALRRERFDVVVEAGHWTTFSLTAGLLARVVARGAPIVGHDRGDSRRFLSHPVAHDPANGVVEVVAKLELLRPFGLPDDGLAPDTELGRDPGPADALLAQAGLAGRPFVVLNPGARLANRRARPALHGAVARGLAARGLGVLVVWGPGEEVLARAVAETGGVTFAPPTNLALLAGLMRRARLVVSNNSGPMHLAVAAGAPTVGIFYSGDSDRWGHPIPGFAAAEVRSEDDAAIVLAACDRLLAAAPYPVPVSESSR